MRNWYFKLKTLVRFASFNENDLPFIQAQILLAEISKKMPQNHPLKGKAYYAGGAVRDEILGQIPKDLDIVVEYPQGGILFAQYLSKLLNLREPVIYPTFGTAQLRLKNISFDGVDYEVDGVDLEFVQTRKEQYHENSRKPETEFGTLMEDVERRDLTVNSLLKTIDSGPSFSIDEAKEKIKNGEILDLTGYGISDMENGIIRTPLDPNIIFSEDPLRMMRAIRFSVRYGWKMTDEVMEGIKNNLDRLSTVSYERIRDELDKISKYGKMHLAIPLMEESGLLKKVMPEMHALIGVEQDARHHSEGDAYVHTLKVIEALEKNNPGSSPYLVWAAIAHDWGKLAKQTKNDGKIQFIGHEYVSAELIEKRMRQLKYPVKEIEKTVNLVKNHMRGHAAGDWKPATYNKFYRQMGDLFDDSLILLQADEDASVPESGEKKSNYRRIKETIENPTNQVRSIPKKPILDGNKIMEIIRQYNPNYKAGPAIGKVMSLQMDLIDENPSMFSDDAIKNDLNMKSLIIADPRYYQILMEEK